MLKEGMVPPKRYLRLLAAVFIALYFLTYFLLAVDPEFQGQLSELSMRYGLFFTHHMEWGGCGWNGAPIFCWR
jgi:hypothetical protein